MRGHGHAHPHPVPGATLERAFRIGVALNLGFVALEAAAGWAANSLALLSDAGHNLSDVLALLLAWAAAWAAQRPATARYTWGWRRGAPLVALINATLLAGALAVIAWEAVRRLAAPLPVDGVIVIAVAAAGIVVNGVTAWMFAKDRHGDLNVRGAFLHMVADAAVSAGVLVGGIAVAASGWLWIDPAISLVIVAVIGMGTVPLLRQSFALSLDAVPEGIDLEAVRVDLLGRPGVAALHDLHVWPLGSTGAALSVHLVMPAGADDLFLATTRGRLLERFGIEHVTLQVERGEHPCPQNCER
jgi:cobalt-zinc-cadmium efflux system protein